MEPWRKICSLHYLNMVILKKNYSMTKEKMDLKEFVFGGEKFVFVNEKFGRVHCYDDVINATKL